MALTPSDLAFLLSAFREWMVVKNPGRKARAAGYPWMCRKCEQDFKTHYEAFNPQNHLRDCKAARGLEIRGEMGQ